MTRSRASARKAGTAFETLTADYLAQQLGDDRIERRRLNGNKDRGDISGVRFMGQRIVVECKDEGGQIRVGEWLTKAEVKRGNDDAGVALVIAKRRGRGNPGEQTVIMTLADLVSLLTGNRPEEDT
jgi:hypothetical protein